MEAVVVVKEDTAAGLKEGMVAETKETVAAEDTAVELREAVEGMVAENRVVVDTVAGPAVEVLL